MSEMLLVLQREFLERVRTRSFLIGTLLFPAVLAGALLLPRLFMDDDGAPRRIAVVDEAPPGVATRFVQLLTAPAPGPEGERANRYTVELLPGPLEAVRARLNTRVAADSLHAYVVFPADVLETGRVLYRARTMLGPVAFREVQAAASHAIQAERLRRAGLAYPCACTRRESAGRYPGRCRNGLPPGRAARAWRFRVAAGRIGFRDRWQGWFEQDVEAETGDFILLRADGFFAYQLAVVVDDAAQGVTHVVRGADLLDSTPRQILLQRALGQPQPAYLHHPVATDGAGRKLSKQNRAPALDPARDRENLRAALSFLGLEPPPDAAAPDLLRWAAARWRLRFPLERPAAGYSPPCFGSPSPNDCSAR